MRVLVSGCGRIGRAMIRMLLEQDRDLEIYAHDPGASEELLLYLIRYDSLHGRLDALELEQKLHVVEADTLAAAVDRVGGETLDFVVDSRPESAAKGAGLLEDLATGQQTVVIVTRPSDDGTVWVEGVTDPAVLTGHRIISTSSCDVVALAPVLDYLSRHYDVREGSIITLHPWLSNQPLLDGVGGDNLPALELHRAAPGNLIPKETSAIGHLERLLPHLAGRLGGFSYRVPTPVVTAAVISLQCSDLSRSSGPAEVLGGLAAECGHVSVTAEPLVSSDVEGSTRMCVVDLRRVRTIGQETILVPLWYDNEVGYAAHAHRLLARLASNP